MLNYLNKFVCCFTINILININLIKSDSETWLSKHPRTDKAANIFNFKNAEDMIELDEIAAEYHHDLVDMGKGYPNLLPPKYMIDAYKTTLQNESTYKTHQYARYNGVPQLVTALAELYTNLLKRDIDPLKEILVTVGASHALGLAARAYLNPGDQVILFEPFYNLYEKTIKLAGGEPIFIPLRTLNGKVAKIASDLTFNKDELASKFNEKTRMIWINNPNNPAGKSFTEEELKIIGELCETHNVIIVMDEVGSFHQFEKPKFTRMATLPGMWNRTLTIDSGSKTFSTTGWRIGWVVGPEELVWSMGVVLKTALLGVSTPTQTALALGIETENKKLNTDDSYYALLSKKSKAIRDRVLSALSKAGVDYIKPTTGYFFMANFTNLVKSKKINLSGENDDRPSYKIMFWLLKNKNLLLYPGAAYYSEENRHLADNTVRICFNKNNETLAKFENIMKNLLTKPITKKH